MQAVSNYIEAQNGLADLVFEELLVDDMLGFLLSPVHLIKQLIRMTANQPDEVTEQIKLALSCPTRFACLHEELFSKADGFFIQESDYDRDSLMAMLDDRYDQSWAGDEAEDDFLCLFEKISDETMSLRSPVIEQGLAHRKFYQNAEWASQ